MEFGLKAADTTHNDSVCRLRVGRLEMGDKFTSSLSDAGELLLQIQDFSPSDVGEYKVIVENEFGVASQIIRMDMAGRSLMIGYCVYSLPYQQQR